MPRQRVFGYTRVSTQDQVDGYGLPMQEAASRAYCRTHKLTLVGMLADEGQSGSNGLDDRVGLAQALARIERGEASALVVRTFDRLARDLILQETIIRQLQAKSADVLSVIEPAMEGEDHTRDMVRQMFGVIAQYERAVIRGRMMAGKAAKRAAGGYVGGTPAYGLRVENGELVNDPDEAKIVGLVVTMRKDNASYRTIRDALKDKGYTTRCGGGWNPAQIMRIAKHAGVG